MPENTFVTDVAKMDILLGIVLDQLKIQLRINTCVTEVLPLLGNLKYQCKHQINPCVSVILLLPDNLRYQSKSEHRIQII